MAGSKTFILVLLGIFLVLAVFLGVWIFKLYNVNMSATDKTLKTVDCVGYVYTITESSYDSTAGRLSVAAKNLNYAENDLVLLTVASQNKTVNSTFVNTIIPGESGTLNFVIPLINGSFRIYPPGCAKYALNCRVGEACR